MSEQFYSYGANAASVLAEGYSSRKRLPLGYYLDDGLRRFRYAYIRGCSRPGTLLEVGKYAGSYFTCTSAYFRSASPGFGGAIGDTTVRLYSAKFIASANAPATSGFGRFEEGFLEVVSGTGNWGHSYKIDHYNAGKAGKASLLFLKDPIRVALGSDTRAHIRANPYWGLTSCAGPMKFGAAGQVHRIAGAGVNSAATSGYGFVQTKGHGIGISNMAIASGVLVGPGAVGRLSSILLSGPGAAGTSSFISTSPIPLAKSVGNATGVGQYLAVDWKIE